MQLGSSRQYAIVIGRLFAHYPNLQKENAAAMTSDITADMVKNKIPLCCLIDAISDFRNDGNSDTRFPPKPGELLIRAKDKFELWKFFKEKMVFKKEKVEPVAQRRQPLEVQRTVDWQGLKYHDCLTMGYLPQIRAHIAAMDASAAESVKARAKSYRLYLQSMMDFPAGSI